MYIYTYMSHTHTHTCTRITHAPIRTHTYLYSLHVYM